MKPENVRSPDGTRIAFERIGDGPPLVLVAAALQGRATYRPLAEELAEHFTVFNYDRRGRGDSGDTAPYAVEREVEDLGAVMAEAGGRAFVYGHSSGAALVLHAAARGLPIDMAVLHEPPFGTGSEQERQAEEEEAERISALLERGRHGDAVRAFLAPMGLPPEMLDQLSEDPALQANAPTILYDPFEIMSESSRGGHSPSEQASGVTAPALVLAGGASPEWMIDASRQVAAALPQGRFRVLPDEGHIVPPESLAPVLTEFLTDKRPVIDDVLATARAGLRRLTPAEAAAAAERGALLVDTRPQYQREADGEVPGAIVIERNHLEWRLDPTSAARTPEAARHDVVWVVLCDEGYSSSLAAASLQALGLRNATDVIGGFQAWKRAGLPVTAPATPTTAG